MAHIRFLLHGRKRIKVDNTDWYDWQEVVSQDPKGYVELNDGKRLLHGPIKSIRITTTGIDFVEIRLKWTARMPLAKSGLRDGEWEAVPNNLITFPNLAVPFLIESMPGKGKRVRFGLNLLYFDDIPGVDPRLVKGLEIPAEIPPNPLARFWRWISH